LDLDAFYNVVGTEIVTQFNNIDHTLETTTLSKESEALFKLYKLIKSKTEKKCEDNIKSANNNEMDNLPIEVEKNKGSIATINRYDDEHCFMEHDFIQVDEDTIYMKPKKNIEINHQLLLPVSEPIEYSIENNLLNSVDYRNNFNITTENSNFHLEPNTINLIPEKNFDIPNTINNLLDEESKENYKATPLNKKKKLQISPIDLCLIWPKTPEYKGKRNSERVPFVLSSRMWQSMYEQKEAVKKDIEDEKEKNRKKRLEYKLTKSLKTNLKSVT